MKDYKVTFAIIRSDNLILECAWKMDSGTCYASIPSWYFDTTAGECMMFTYGGCDGNANRFDTKKKCADTCMGYIVDQPGGGGGGYPKKDDSKDDEEEKEKDSQRASLKQ